MNAVDHLRRIPLFADLTAEEMVDVLRLAKESKSPAARSTARSMAAEWTTSSS